jgi:putative flippase GtrA
MHRFHAWSSTCWQFLRYCLVGGANSLLDLLVLNVLLWGFPTKNVLVLVVYNSLAYTCGAVTSFFLNKYWTFGHKQPTTRRQVRRFVIILALEILYSNGLVWLAGKVLQPLIANPTLWGNASKLVAVAGGAVLSYTFMRFWIFANGSHNQHKEQEPL